MTWTRSVLTASILGAILGTIPGVPGGRLLAAQDLPAKNPLEGNPDAIRGGMGLFRGRCADCHGMDARGVRGPDITQVWASGRTDDGLFKTIKGGIPGTEMPANPRIFDHEAWQILAYLRTLAAPAPTDPPRGNAENGEKIFRAKLRQLSSRERRRRTPGARPVAHRRRAVARHDGAADSRRRRGVPARDTNR